MTPRTYRGVVVDLCSRCGSVYLDPGEAERTDIDEATLFGHHARPVGASERLCPCRRSKMTCFAVDIGDHELVIERSSCCGGVFLDAREHAVLVRRTLQLAQILQPAGRSCPRCSRLFSVHVDGNATIDRCDQCGAVFFDIADLESKGLDTGALFGEGPEAARDTGESSLTCPIHGQPMRRVELVALGTSCQVERTTCCGGVFLDQGEQATFTIATRVAKTAWADRKYAEGESLMDEEQKAKLLDEADRAATAERIRKLRPGKIEIGPFTVGSGIPDPLRPPVRKRHPRTGGPWEDDWDPFDDW